MPDVISDPKALLVYSTACSRIDTLISDFRTKVEEVVQGNRRERNIDISVQQLRNSGDIKPDETFIPARIVDTNIRREAPLVVRYFTEPRRFAVFKDVIAPITQVADLEAGYTDGMRYTGWLNDWYRTWDGAAVHGWDSVEVVLDTSKTLHCYVDHVGTENLIFPTRAKNIQNCELIMRRFKFSQLQLRQAVVKYGFDAGQVALVMDKVGEQLDNTLFDIYKCFCKVDGVVHVMWKAKDGAMDWLKKPEPLYLGRNSISMQPQMAPNPLTGQQINVGMQEVRTPIYESIYPFFVLDYTLTEEDVQIERKGRVFFDSPKQEAMTAMQTAYVNGTVRASGVYGSPSGDSSGATGAPKQLECEIESGRLYDRKIDFWGMPYPDASVLQGLQYMATANSEEVGQVDYAVQNRKDTEKTATEIKAAQQTSSELSNVSIALLSQWCSAIHNFVWLIVQSRAIEGLVPLLSTGSTDMNGVTLYTNNKTKLQRIYLVTPAGDPDVIERMQRLQKKQEFWPVVSMTPIAIPFLKSMLLDAFPYEGEQFAQMLDAGANDKNLIAALWQLVQKEAAEDKQKGELEPGEEQAVAQLGQQVQQSLGIQTNGNNLQEGSGGTGSGGTATIGQRTISTAGGPQTMAT